MIDLGRASSTILGVTLIALIATCSGCGGESFEKPVPVSGTVNVKGKPLKDGVIMFTPVDRKSTPFGRGVIEDGAYVASSINPEDGLVPGEYLVYFDVNPENEKSRDAAEIPFKYMSPGTSGLKKTIEEETDSLDFNLE